jgi:hypothetical protein
MSESALHDAARLLIAEASPTTVRAVLRMLLDDVATPPAAVTARPTTARSNASLPGQALPTDPEWLALKARLRAAMAEREADYAAIGAAIGQATNTVRLAISRSVPPSEALRAKLAGWLEASEVAAAPLPSCGGRGSNGAAAPPDPTPRAPAPSESALQAGCCWEERLGASGLSCCGAPVAAGKSWCAVHARLHALGKQLAGRTAFVQRGFS